MKIQEYLENKRIFANNLILATAALCDVLFGTKLLIQVEIMDEVSQIAELAIFFFLFWKDGNSFNERSEAEFVVVLNTELCSYISKNGPFSKSLYFETTKVVKSAACCELFIFFLAKLMLIVIAVKISTICFTLASCNGLWSGYGLEQTQSRNHIKHETANKILMVRDLIA